MISWIVASHDPRILNRHLLPSLVINHGDELVLVEDAISITDAYAKGQQQSVNPVHCYIHHDVQILDLPTLRSNLIEHTEWAGLVGVIGSRNLTIPWWIGDVLGSVRDSRLGVIDFGPGGECAVVDGLLLATRYDIDWDLEWPGWHGYDLDAATQLYHRNLPIWCLTDGKNLLSHNSDSSFNLEHVDGWSQAIMFYRNKWG